MLTTVVLGPVVETTMRGMRGTSGSAFSLHRSMSNVAPSSSQLSYFWPMMGLFNTTKQRDQEESDNRGESSGWASGTHHGGSGSGSVSSGRRTQTVRTGRSGHGPNMHISGNQARPGQPRIVMEVDSSRAMVEDYVRHSLEKKAIPWENGQRDVRPNEAQRAMRDLGDQLEESFGESIDGMINRLHFAPDNGQEKLTTAMEELFADGEVNWGRIAVLVKFAGKLSVHCARDQSRPQLVHSIVDWVSHYVDTRLRSWIAEHNGWAGFVKFHEDKKESGSSSLRRLLTVGVGAAAAGLLTLGALWRS